MLNEYALTDPLFSRRRRQQAQARLPDWVWGAGIGLIVVVFIGGYFLISGIMSGGSGSTCDNALAPLGTSTVDAEAFATEDAALGNVLALLERGDRAGSEAAFYGPVHNFTHNVDPPLREVDETLAKELCRNVIELENNLTGRVEDTVIVGDLERVRENLRDAAEAMGYPRPGAMAPIQLEGRQHGWTA